jgi:tetratricopeptide (TPR) repeat protein
MRALPRPGKSTSDRIVFGVLLCFLLTPAIAAAPPPARAASPLSVTADMRAWARQTVRDDGDDLSRVRSLHAALTGDGPRGLREIVTPTPSAIVAFATRRADCLGYGLLLVGLGRSVGADVGFALATAVDQVDELGTLRLRRGHLVAVAAGRVFDLGGEAAFDPARHRRISDRTAIALYHSNRGVQSLAAGRPAEAVDWLWRALRFDPSLAAAWTNLGVALRRAGDPAGAVLAHEMALRIDPADGSALSNLAIARAGEGRP